MLKTRQINKEIVKPIKVPTIDPERIGGYSLFENIYPNIFLCAKKNSGKTNAIFKILQKCVGKNTDIYIFCSTAKKDSTWKAIIKYFKKKKNNIYTYLSIKEDKDNILQNILDELKDPEEDSDEDSDREEKESYHKKPLIIVDNEEEEEEKEGKSKKVYPESIFIFDDIGNELISKTITQFLKTNRHYRPKIIISSQNVNDIHPAARNQIDYWLLFGGHSKTKMEEIHKNAALSLELEDLMKLYDYATEDKYSFLYIDTRKNKYRKNFNTEIEIE